METPAPTTDPAPTQAQQPEPQKGKPGRKPLDAAARDASAQRSIARKMAKKLSAAKNTEEFWVLAEELAQKGGRKPVKVAAAEEEKPAAPDPLDVPIAKSWPTPRQMAEVAPAVAGGLGMLAEALDGTRYGVLTKPIKVPGPDKTTIEIDRKDVLATPLTAVAALLTGGRAPDLHPGWALVLATAFVFGPPAAAHAWEIAGPKVIAWWSNGKTPPPAAPQAVANEEKAGPKLVKGKAAPA